MGAYWGCRKGRACAILSSMEAVVTSIIILFLLIVIVGKSSSWAVRAATTLSHMAGVSEFTISVLIITLISILPETAISVLSALQGVPSLGLGILLGSNVADLSFVFGVIALLSRRGLATDRAFIAENHLFLGFLMLPLVLGFNGYFSRLDGVLLIIASVLFFSIILKGKRRDEGHLRRSLHQTSFLKEIAILSTGLILLGSSAYFAVQYASDIAGILGVAPALIGILVALGTTLPEFTFSLRASRGTHAALAVGDVWGTVITDATLVLGIIALIQPFPFNPRLIILTGVFMLLAGMILFALLRSGRVLTRGEGALLLAFYFVFVIVEFTLRNWTPIIAR